jgi:hypothetical protein
MTRYEAAALLNACLDRVTEITDEVRGLVAEFESELAVLSGRVDGLEARVGELEATQFSTTTKLKGVTNWVLGAASYDGTGSDAESRANGGTSFSYNFALNLETSFSGEDMLYTRLRSGNMANIYGGNGIGLFAQEYGFDNSKAVEVNRLYYSFPVGEEFTIVGGPVVRMDDMLPVWPSAYPSDMTMDFFTYAGAPGAYNLTLGGGAGVYWQNDDGFSVSTSYISADGNSSNSETGGVATDGAGTSATTQIAYAPEGWGVAAAYTYASGAEGGGALYSGNGTTDAVALSQSGNSNSFGLSAWWTPEESGFIPSVSTGWGISNVDDSNIAGIDSATSQSWYVGLEWSDVFVDGNSFGMAFGQPTFVTDIDESAGSTVKTDEGGYAWEFFYKFQVTDNITVTPAIHYLTSPNASNAGGAGLDDAFSGLIKTTFKF